MKMGRTSCLTTGVVEAWDASGLVVYRNDCNNASTGKALFDHQILIFGEPPGGKLPARLQVQEIQAPWWSPMTSAARKRSG
jgi:hypothetical protein